MKLPLCVSYCETMTACVPKEAGEGLDVRQATVGRTDVSSSDLDTVATSRDPSDVGEADAVMSERSTVEGENQHDQNINKEEEMKMSDSDHQDKISDGLTKYKVKDSVDCHSQDMLHYLGRPVNSEAGFGVGNNGDMTRERLRQLATARLAEQGQRVMNEANFLFRREAAAMQQKVNMTVASKPLYSIGAPQRIRMPKQPVRYPVQLHRHLLYDGPLNLVNRPLMSAHPYGVVHQSVDSPMDLSKPLDLSMKSDSLVAVSRAPTSITDPRLIANAEILANQPHAVCSNGHNATSNVTSAQTMYRPPPMMSYGKPGQHGNSIHSHPTVQSHHSLLPKDLPISHSQLHPLASTSVGPHFQATQNPLKRPAPVMARAASDIPRKQAVHDSSLSLAKERLKVAPSSSVPTSVSLQTYQETRRAALLAYERGRGQTVALINQRSQDSQLRITDVRSIGPRVGTSHAGPKPTSGQTRPHTTKAGSAPVFHHIHHHHHHHHVPQPDEELRPGSNGASAVHGRAGVPVHAGVLAQGNDAVTANSIPAHDVPVHRLAGRVIPGHDVPTHGMSAPSMASRGDRPHSVLIKHASTPVSTITSPHLRRAHYHTRRRYRSISPPTLVSISNVTALRRDSTSVTSTPGRAHNHARAVSPLKLVASSIAAGAKMNELLKPLDGPEQPDSRGHNGAIVTDTLARPLRVDIPDDRAFVSRIGGVYSGQANPVPLMRQVGNVANITKCLTSEANSSPKKSNSSGNESPTMPVLTPQSVYSPCFTTESATNLTHMSSSTPPTSSPLFYNALTLPLYPLKHDVSAETGQRFPTAKDKSPPHLHETSPEQLVPDQHVPNQIDSEMTGPDRRAEKNRVESSLQIQIDNYFLDAAAAFDKNKREQRRLKETLQEQRDAYRRYKELCRGPLASRDKPRKRHMHSYSLKASMDKVKTLQAKKVKEKSQSGDNQDDRNIFAELMMPQQWYKAKSNTKITANDGQPQQQDVIDLTTSPSSSPAPDVLGSIVNRYGGSSGIGKKKSDKAPVLGSKDDGGLGYSVLSALGEGKTVSVSEAIDAVFAAHLPVFPSIVPHIEHIHPDTNAKKLDPDTQRPRRVPHEIFDRKDQPPKLVKVQASPVVASAVSPSVDKTCTVITSAKSSSVLSTFFTTNDISEAETSLVYSSNPLSSSHVPPSFLEENSTVENPQLTTTTGDVPQPIFLGKTHETHSMMSSASSLPHHLRYSPTEKTFSHDPRKKLLAAMSVHTPTLTRCAVSPASVAASLSSTVSPSSGRSTPSKSAARRRSLEISRLENTSSFVTEIPKRRQNVDLLTDPALLDREERALQRAMKRFKEMEKRERVTPTHTQTEPPTHIKRQNRLLFSRHSTLFRRGGRGRGRKFLSYQRLHQMHKDNLTAVLGTSSRRSFCREMRRLNSHAGRNTFQDFVPMVLEERTRHSLATRSSSRERKVYHKNARYEMEIEKEEQKYLERKRQKRSVSGSTSGEEDSSSSRSKIAPARRRKGSEDVLKTSSDANLVTKEQTFALSGELDSSTDPQNLSTDCVQESPPTEEGVATSPSMDPPLHVVIDPTNLTKMKFMTSSAYQLHRKDSVKENRNGSREDVEGKHGGKRKFKTKHLGPETVTMETGGRHDVSISIKTEVLDDHATSGPPSLPPSEPIPVKVVKPCPPAEMKRLMVNKKLGETILHRAARLAYDDVAIYCIDYDVVNINAKDNAGYTPLHECCVHGRLRVALHLLQHGADVNASAADGTRPIHDAVDNNWLALVRLLLMYGADPLITTYSGRTTIKLARTKAMKTFIIGYLSDVNGYWELDEDDPYQSNLDLCWHIAGTHSFDANDLAVSDIFQDVPEEEKDQSEEEFLVELSETPHLPSYNIRLPKEQRTRNWLLLTDVTNQLDTTRTDLLASNRNLHRVTMTHDEFTIAIKDSQLDCVPPEKSQIMLDKTSGNYIVEMLELTSELRRTLHIEEEYV